jgi:hypothetical protein
MSGADVAELRQRLTDPHQLCTALGLLDGYKPGRQAGGGLLIRCPAHGERHPSCSVRRGRDGTIQVRCFSCDFGGDALSLVAAARGLDPRHQFGAVLSEAARLAGYSLEAPRGESHSPTPSRGESPPVDPSRVKLSPVQLPPEPPAYPDEREVADVWAASSTVEGDEQARAYLVNRAIDPGRVAALDLVRVLPVDFRGPSWARYQGKPWAAAGYRLLVPMVDAHGALRSLRAWRLAPSSEDPKRVAPAGKAMAGLVMACPIARGVLQTGQSAAEGPLDVVITEGEPDFLTHAARPEGAAAPAVLGVVASAWSSAVADRLPGDVRIVIRTHRDAAGDRYAADIRSSLADRVRVLDFSRPSDPSMKLPDDNDDAQNGELHSYLDNIEPAVVPRTVPSSQVTPSDTWSTVGALVERLRNAPAKLHTGIANIDDGWRGGAPAGLLWVIGGAPGAGKTTWVTNLGHEWALHGVPVAYVAGDEAREGILIRLGQQAGIDRKYLEEGAPVALDDLEKYLAELPMLLVDPDEDIGVDVATVATALRRRWPVEGDHLPVGASARRLPRRYRPDERPRRRQGERRHRVRSRRTVRPTARRGGARASDCLLGEVPPGPGRALRPPDQPPDGHGLRRRAPGERGRPLRRGPAQRTPPARRGASATQPGPARRSRRRLPPRTATVRRPGRHRRTAGAGGHREPGGPQASEVVRDPVERGGRSEFTIEGGVG